MNKTNNGFQSYVNPDGFLDANNKVNISLFKKNREKLIKIMSEQMNENSTIILQGGKNIPIYDTDDEYLFRQESFFTYLFGINEPGCYGTINTIESVLFIPRLALETVAWMGKIKPPSFYREKYGIDSVYYSDEIENVLSDKNIKLLYLNKGTNFNSGIESTPANFKGIEHFNTNTTVLYGKLCECRVIKSDQELELLRFINKISSEAHIHVMKQAKNCKSESDLEAEFLYYIRRYYGCRYVSYTCICCSGQNGSVLHYGQAGAPNDRKYFNSDVLLLDMGAEYFGYDSDITCSFPVSGKFTPEQKLVYNAVLSAQKEVEKVLRAGISWGSIQKVCLRVLTEHLISMKLIIPYDKSIDEIIDLGITALFMPHSFGHLMGLDTHDVDSLTPLYPIDEQVGDNPEKAKKRKNSLLRAGMVITNEPGIYFIEDLLYPAFSDQVKSPYLNSENIIKYMEFGGVRLEDDVIIHEDGCENMTKVPRSIEEIEQVMNEQAELMCAQCYRN